MSYGDLEALDFLAFPIPMPTVIARIYTPDGFVVAADGRDFHFESSTVLSESVQKIFRISNPNRELAYSFTGTAGITPKDSGNVVFNMIGETTKAVEELSQRKFRSLWHYADALRETLWPLPETAIQALRSFESPLQETTIFLDGYYEGRPKRAHIKLYYDGQEPDVSVDELHPGAVLGTAIMGVLKILMVGANDGPLAAYQTPILEIATMAEALESAKKVVEAHCDPEAIHVDSKCAAMGGHLHMCKITSADGFQWIIKPLQ